MSMIEYVISPKHTIRAYPPPEVSPLDGALMELKCYKDERRARGFVFEGITMDADADAVSAITGAVLAFELGLAQTTDWKGRNGWIRGADAQKLQQIAAAMTAFVNGCFQTESLIAGEIAALSPQNVGNYNIRARWSALGGP